MKKQILLGLLAVGLLTACSSDNSLTENNETNQYGMVEGQPSYINVGIALPAEPQTRANDDFDNGLESEYVVKSGKLVLFKGTSETDAVIFGSYDIPTELAFRADETSSNQITSSSDSYVQEITAPELAVSQKLFAYAILNNSGNDTGIDYTAGTTWTAFSQQVLKAIGIANEANGHGAMGSNGLVMTNVPLSLNAGGTEDPSVGAAIKTLAEIDPTAVYKTAEAAAAGTQSACIYVERAAAKVQVAFQTSPAVTSPNGATATLLGWSLGNVNNGGTTGSGYYNSRQFNTDWLAYANDQNLIASTHYRFVCENKLAPAKPAGVTHDDRYRTYFGYDVNYNGNTGLINTKVTAYPYDNTTGKDVAYTYENTFDENSQIYKNTTYAALKVELNGGTTFFTIGTDKKTMYSETAAGNKLTSIGAAQQTAYIENAKTTIQGLIAADLALGAGHSKLIDEAGCSATSVISFTIKPVFFEFKAPDANNVCDYEVNLVLSSVAVGGAGNPTDIMHVINAMDYPGASMTVQEYLEDKELPISPKETVTIYPDGITYYAVRIAHFGDYETPWSAPNSAYNVYDKIYPTNGKSIHDTPINYGASRAAAWLGRWGVVRNNWYDIKVTNISAVGSAVPVEYSADVTPDDNVEGYYISAHIHILPWVKRQQSAILK